MARKRFVDTPGGEVAVDAWDRAGLPRNCQSGVWSRPPGRDETVCALHGLTAAEHEVT